MRVLDGFSYKTCVLQRNHDQIFSAPSLQVGMVQPRSMWNCCGSEKSWLQKRRRQWTKGNVAQSLHCCNLSIEAQFLSEKMRHVVLFLQSQCLDAEHVLPTERSHHIASIPATFRCSRDSIIEFPTCEGSRIRTWRAKRCEHTQ